MADELGLTLKVDEGLKTTVVAVRTELLELFCTDVVGFFPEQQESEWKEEKHMHGDDSSPWTWYLSLTLCCFELERHIMGVCD